jgi:hypothetical protein
VSIVTKFGLRAHGVVLEIAMAAGLRRRRSFDVFEEI